MIQLNVIPWKLVLAAVLVCAAAGSIYLNTLLLDKVESMEEKISVLESQRESLNHLIGKYKDSTESAMKETKELRESINRVGAIAQKKNTLLTKRIKQSYSDMHKQKACASGNKEACNAK